MKIVTIKQGSKDWHAWRGKGLGASDAPAVMGESPWTSRFQLWGEKCGLLERPPFNVWQQAAVDKGTRLEPEARAWYENKTGRVCQPLAGTNDSNPFIRASFDGITQDLKHFIEIKCPGKDAHEKALKGEVPKYYLPQIHHQYLVSGATSMDYVSYRDGEGIILPIAPDLAYQLKLLFELKRFWKCVETLTPPKLESGEIFKLVGSVKTDFERVKKSFIVLDKVLDQLLAPIQDGDGFTNVS